MSQSDPIRVFLVDDHETLREGLRAFIEGEGDLRIEGEASTGEEALDRIPGSQTLVAVVDYRLPDLDGIELCRRLTETTPGVRTLLFTAGVNIGMLGEVWRAGARGCLLKSARSEQIVDAIRRVASGERVVDERLTVAMVDVVRAGGIDDPLGRLTPQERRIFKALAHGSSNREIADQLGLAEKTVKNHMSGLLAKLGLRRTQAAMLSSRIREETEGPGT